MLHRTKKMRTEITDQQKTSSERLVSEYLNRFALWPGVLIKRDDQVDMHLFIWLQDVRTLLWSHLLMFPFSSGHDSCSFLFGKWWFTDWLYLFLGFSSTNKPSDDVFKTSLWNCNAQASRTSCFLRSTTVVFGRDSAGRASIVTSSSCPAFFSIYFLTLLGEALLSSYHFK